MVATFPGADNGTPSWSRDGQWIYFHSDRSGGKFQLWKVRLQGGSPVQVTRNGGAFAAESTDGRFVYYSKSDVSGIWRMPSSGGEETRILDQPEEWDSRSWALTRDGIYLLKQTRLKPNIEFFEFATRKTILISRLNAPASLGLDVSPDGKSIVFVRHDAYESNVMLVKDFR
jgi:Tol biopolymer transport system component